MQRMKSYSLVITGQVFLIICVVFYLIWWSISYQPGQSVNRIAGVRGVLLLTTVLCGLAGIVLSIVGVYGLPIKIDAGLKMNGIVILIGGAASYFLLLAVTYAVFYRPVTTELVLIVGWSMLELAVVNAMNGADILSDTRFDIMIVVIIAAFLISIVLYVLYYRMEAWKAFYAAMVPLITDGIGMLILLLLLRTA